MYLISIFTIETNARKSDSMRWWSQFKLPCRGYSLWSMQLLTCLCYLVSFLQYQNAILDAYDLSTEWGIRCLITCYIGEFEWSMITGLAKLLWSWMADWTNVAWSVPVTISAWVSLKRGLHDFFLHVRCVSLSCQPCLGIGTVCPTSMGHVQPWPFVALHMI